MTIRPRSKKQAVAVQDQFGAAHGALRQASQVQQVNGPTSFESEPDEYFYAISTAANTEKRVPKDLIKDNYTLTTMLDYWPQWLASLSLTSNSCVRCKTATTVTIPTLIVRTLRRHAARLCTPIDELKSFMPLIISLSRIKTLSEALGDGKVICDNWGHLNSG